MPNLQSLAVYLGLGLNQYLNVTVFDNITSEWAFTEQRCLASSISDKCIAKPWGLTTSFLSLNLYSGLCAKGFYKEPNCEGWVKKLITVNSKTESVFTKIFFLMLKTHHMNMNHITLKSQFIPGRTLALPPCWIASTCWVLITTPLNEKGKAQHREQRLFHTQSI